MSLMSLRGPFMMNLGGILESGLRAAGDREIVTYGGMRLSYPAFADRVRRLGLALTQLGIQQGQRVAVLDRDTHRYLEAYFAVPMLGATLMTANIRLSVEQLRYTLSHSGAQLVLCAVEFLPLLGRVLEGMSPLPRVVAMGAEDTSTTCAFVAEYEALITQADSAFLFPAVPEDAIATLFYTTGTTGLPKGVFYTHRQLVEHTLAVGLALASADTYQSLRVGDVYLPLTPMFHVHAWGLPYLATLLGLKQVYPGRYDAQALPDLVIQEQATFSHGVPTVLQMVLDAAEKQGKRFTGWKMMVGGSAMAPALAARARKLGVQVFAAYGMSETCPVLCIARTDDVDAAGDSTRLCRVGQPVPLVDLKLQMRPGEIIDSRDPRVQGELVVRARWLTPGYYRDEEGTSRLWADDYLHTGDVAAIDGDGAVRIVDRLKDVIKSGGEWISSLDLEASLREHADVEEAAVVGVADEKWGERPRAFVRLTDRAALRDQEVLAELRSLLDGYIKAGRFPRFAMPDEIRVVEEIPKTSVGKLDKKRLRSEFLRA